jgi:hypothetical protein
MSKKHQALVKRLQKHGSDGFAIGWEAAVALEATVTQSEVRKQALRALLEALSRNTLFSPNGHWEQARKAIEE